MSAIVSYGNGTQYWFPTFVGMTPEYDFRPIMGTSAPSALPDGRCRHQSSDIECAIKINQFPEDPVPNTFRSSAAIAGLFWLALPTTGSAAEIKVLNANALTIAMKELAAEFSKETGHQVSFVGVSPGLVESRVKAGEVYDLVITATASAEAFEKEGKFRAGTRHPLARVGIGLAVRDGVKLDLSTVEFDPQGAHRRQDRHLQRLEHRRIERRKCPEGARQSRPHRCGQG